MVVHSFSFDVRDDSPDAVILDYQYGSSNEFGTRADPEAVKRGQQFYQTRIYGQLPRGEFLYVKWRIKESGKVYEDRIDLARRLPPDIQNRRIHFVVRGPQLYVYLLPPHGKWPVGDFRIWPPEKTAAFLKQRQIYPDGSLKLQQREFR